MANRVDRLDTLKTITDNMMRRDDTPNKEFQRQTRLAIVVIREELLSLRKDIQEIMPTKFPWRRKPNG